MDRSSESWSEEESALYRELAAGAVPARAEQIATLLALIPRRASDPFRVLELGSGQGMLGYAVLETFPRARLHALDGSVSMREEASRRLAPFEDRCSITAFDLSSTEWHHALGGVDVVLSSLCLHHLDGEKKRLLFAEVHRRLASDGALLVADLVEPQRAEARELFASSWDWEVRRRAQAHRGSTRLFERFLKERWNYYRFPDPVDRPSPLYAQLRWLDEAGFSVVDCFWLRAGHAVYGGYKTSAPPAGAGPTWSRALSVARRALRTHA